MGIIRVLDKHVAELIAAGEVVERPASVIKELVENALDAGATVVTVEVQRGGVTYLRVTDNGCGIAREDVPTAFLRHATSKVRTQDDLSGIRTLGFRGEALASVAAVGRVELLTKTADEEAGTCYRIAGGEEVDCTDAGCPDGTTLIVRDLFYNTPARMKFLKKDVAEGNAAADVVDKLALTHPEVAFRFIRDGKETLNTPGDGKLLSAIHAVYGGTFAASLIPASYAVGGLEVTGYISKPTAARANRHMQLFMVNGRFVKTRTGMAALSEGYKNSIMVGKFPACVLSLTLPPDMVDVNVHPAKIEVRFTQEKPLFDLVYFAVKTALAQGDSRPAATLERPRPVLPSSAVGTPLTMFDAPSRPAVSRSESPTALPRRPDPAPVRPSVAWPPAPPPQEILSFADETPVSWNTVFSPPPAPPALREEAPAREPSAPVRPAEPEPVVAPETSAADRPEPRLIGEAFATYVLVEAGPELLLIDKHAAHERILFDRLMDNRAVPRPQGLLAPVTVTLGKGEYAALLDHLDDVRAAGFDVDDFGSGTLLVRAVPCEIDGGDVPLLMQEIAGKFLDHRQEVSLDHQEWIYHSVACRAAVKAGDSSGTAELLALARKICADQSVMYCPHGRPVAIRLTRREIEKQFGRIP